MVRYRTQVRALRTGGPPCVDAIGLTMASGMPLEGRWRTGSRAPPNPQTLCSATASGAAPLLGLTSHLSQKPPREHFGVATVRGLGSKDG
mmetsp:Transcript_76328/g.134754  ORF Transcript_76328/g.134754 Transcript_76328/m.134754 type:complete len:90 (+) Transcript_76328:1161-1430(+)